MKKIVSIGVVLLFTSLFLGCNNDDETNNNSSIVGIWQLIEVFQDSGDGSGGWQSVNNGYKYTFTSNNMFFSDRFTECNYGTYSLNANQLTLDFGCSGFTTNIENPNGVFIENISYEANDLILNPTYLFCVEGCGWKFKKIE